MAVDMGAKYDPLLLAARHIEEKRSGLGALFLCVEQKRRMRPAASRAGETRSCFGGDAGGRNASRILVASGRAGDETVRQRPGNQEADRARLSRPVVFAPPMDRAGRAHELMSAP